MTVSPAPSLEPDPPYTRLELWNAWLVGTAIGFVGRVLDLTLLLARPRLLLPYLRVWGAQIRRSPYRWPRSFEAVLATKQAGQTLRELMYGEILLVSAVFLFWRAGVGRGSRVLDLGAGRGRALLAARWLGAEARGVELLGAHVTATRDALASAGAVLEEGDAAQADPSTATHVYLNWCALAPQTQERIRTRLRQCRPGTRILAVIHPIEGEQRAPIATHRVLFTWGTERVHVTQVQ